MTTYRVRTVTFNRPQPQLPRPVELLPPDARQILINASQHMPRSSRVTAINVAINKVRSEYPYFFKEER